MSVDLEAVFELAAERYYCARAAAWLLVAAASPVRSEERYRSQRSLRMLDMSVEITDLVEGQEVLRPEPPPPAPPRLCEVHVAWSEGCSDCDR